MPLTTTFEQARLRRHSHRLPNGTHTWLSSYMGLNVAEQRATGQAGAPAQAQAGVIYPVAFLVEQAPDSTVLGHFHAADEFQVFIEGEGRFGQRPLTGPHLHYAGAYSAYAPIIAGPTGVQYFTLRNGWDPGARWLPQAKAELLPHLRRRRVAFIPVPNSHPGEAGHQREDLLPLAQDGMGAWYEYLGPHASCVGPDPSQGRGQYWLVLRGECTLESEVLGARSLAFLSPEESPARIAACAQGATLIVMQFPALPYS